jgi:hypothetical protein
MTETIIKNQLDMEYMELQRIIPEIRNTLQNVKTYNESADKTINRLVKFLDKDLLDKVNPNPVQDKDDILVQNITVKLYQEQLYYINQMFPNLFKKYDLDRFKKSTYYKAKPENEYTIII